MSSKKGKDSGKSNKGRTPDLTPKQAMAKATEQNSPAAPVVSPVVANAQPIKTTYSVPPAIHADKTKEKASPAVPNKSKHDFDIDAVVNQVRSGAGLMHIRSAMYDHLQGRGALIEDGMSGVCHICHIEVDGFRIPADKNDFFKY